MSSISSLAFLGDADRRRHSAVVHAARVGHAPVDVVMHAHAIARPLTLVKIAQAASASGSTTAIVVANQIILAIERVVTGTDP